MKMLIILGGLICAANATPEIQEKKHQAIPAREELIWMDGSHQPLADLPGELISDNDGLYWGPSPYTGMTYRYENSNLNYPDVDLQNPEVFGNKLIDGKCRFQGMDDGVGVLSVPLVTVFSFRDAVEVSEIDLVCINTEIKFVSIASQEAGAKEWSVIEEFNIPTASGKDFYRFHLKKPTRTDSLRLLVNGGDQTILSEVFIWGKAKHREGELKGIPAQYQTGAREVQTIEPSLISESRELQNEITNPDEKFLLPLKSVGGNGGIDGKTKCGIEFDKQGYLRITFDCLENDFENRMIEEKAGKAAWSDDRIEIEINSGGANKEHYYKIGMNSEGKALRDFSRIIDPTSDGKPFSFQYKFQKNEGGWKGQFRIPIFQIAGGKNSLEQDWNLLINRVRVKKGEGGKVFAQSSWPHLKSGGTMTPDYFGKITFQGRNDQKALESFPGAIKTAFQERDLIEWKKEMALGEDKKFHLTAIHPYQFNLEKPALAQKNTFLESPKMTVSQNEIEGMHWILTNLDPKNSLKLKLDLKNNFPVSNSVGESKGELYIGGAMITRRQGAIIKPLFKASSMLGERPMEKYFINGFQIKSFPAVTLPPGGSIYLYSRVEIAGVVPGVYKIEMVVNDQAAASVPIEVIPLSLPYPSPHFCRTMGGPMDIWPFRYNDHYYRVGKNRADLGINVSEDTQFFQKDRGIYGPDAIQYAEKAMAPGSHYLMTFGTPESIYIPGFKRELKPPLSGDQKQEISGYLNRLVKETERLKLSNDEWFIELWDEPVEASIQGFRAVLEYIKSIQPRVQTYCNISFWEGAGFLEDQKIYDLVQSWHKTVDIWQPSFFLVDPKKFPISHGLHKAGNNKINLCYVVDSEPSRQITWFAIQNQYQGYCLFSDYRPDNKWQPSSNPYNDFDGETFDYVLFYPSMDGPVISTKSEEMREGFEDYKMLRYLRDTKHEALVEKIFKGYQEHSYNQPYANNYFDLRNALLKTCMEMK